VRGQQVLDGIGRLIQNAAGFGKSAIEEWHFFSDGVAELSVGEPGEVVEINGDAWGFFQ